ncbi:MAG: peptide-methionine (S)-S-oxide reductase [Deltaproteobacteria bacterium]|nr:MAG: peptide-methionine (S)-S-oxide reductase [Deltaproteobacteria bacterium]
MTHRTWRSGSVRRSNRRGAWGVGLLLAVLSLSPPSLEAQEKQTREAVATFAGGCFWCMEPPFEKLEGVKAVISGYTGGSKENPTYREVSSGATGHAEAVEVHYDPAKISYERLLEVFWHNIDPTVENRQFCDVGSQYRTAIFYHTEAQRRLAEASRTRLIESGRFGKIFTKIEKAGPFYPAETYHQDYYKTHPLRYKAYRLGCGRDRRLEELWGDP